LAICHLVNRFNTHNTPSESLALEAFSKLTFCFAGAYMGIRWQSITPYIAARFHLPVDWGAYVTDVQANSPAREAGLQPDDIIIRIGDITIDETHSYINTLFLHKPGEQVTVEVFRNGKKIQFQVTLGESGSGS
jgi:serine protease Do